MSTHKCIFYITEKSIQAYEADGDKFILVKKDGEPIYKIDDASQETLHNFFAWFDRSRAVTEEDFIDYCFLSTVALPFIEKLTDDEDAVSFQNPNQNKKAKSSWTKENITDFLNEYCTGKNFEIAIKAKQKFIHQTTNLYDKNNLEKLYLVCVPKFDFKHENKKITKQVESKNKHTVSKNTDKSTDKKNASNEYADDNPEELSITTKFFREMLASKRKN